MGFFDMLTTKKDKPIKDIEKLMEELRDIQQAMTDFSNASDIDTDIAAMLGELKGKDPEKVTREDLIEVLIYLNDKTKTKLNQAKVHFHGVLMRVTHAKLKMLLIYHTGLIKGNTIRQIFSVSTVIPFILIFVFLLATFIIIDKYDKSALIDAGIMSNSIEKKTR